MWRSTWIHITGKQRLPCNRHKNHCECVSLNTWTPEAFSPGQRYGVLCRAHDVLHRARCDNGNHACVLTIKNTESENTGARWMVQLRRRSKVSLVTGLEDCPLLNQHPKRHSIHMHRRQWWGGTGRSCCWWWWWQATGSRKIIWELQNRRGGRNCSPERNGPQLIRIVKEELRKWRLFPHRGGIQTLWLAIRKKWP